MHQRTSLYLNVLYLVYLVYLFRRTRSSVSELLHVLISKWQILVESCGTGGCMKRIKPSYWQQYYYDPSCEHRFISRVEVTRYLEKSGSKTEEKEKVPSKQSPKNVKVEKAEAEGLPPGWTKEVRIKKRGNKVRRDPFYTDPVNGYVFRSMKDALRYVETGELGKLAFKPKEKGSDIEDQEEDDICEPVIVESQKVIVNGPTDETERRFAEHVSNSSGITKEEDILTFVGNGEQTSLSKHTPDQHKAGELSSSNMSEARGSEQIGQKVSEEGVHASGNAVGGFVYKECRDNGVTKDGTGKTQQGTGKTKIKKALNTPRRTSKRLAGVALDPTPEVKATKARRSPIKQLSVAPDGAKNSSPEYCINKVPKQPDLPESSLETNCALDASKSKEPILATSNMLSPGDTLTLNGNFDGKKDKSVLPLGNVMISGLDSGKLESDDKTSDGAGSLINMSSVADLWTDPCIAFAIQTLTGIPCDTPIISESNNGKGRGIQATPEVNGNRIVERQGCGIDVPPTDPAIWKEHAGKVEKGHKTDETAGSSLEMPLADIFADPCIEFAIKTLTGAIPVEYGLDNQDGFQQQPSLAPDQSNNHLTLSDAGIDNFSQTDFICQQYNVAGKSMSKEHGIRNPIYNYSHHRRSGDRP